MEPDAQLIQSCLRGDGPAWEELVRRHTRRVYNLCYRFTGNGAAAEDLSQEVFLRVYRTLGSYQPVYGAFPTWLTSVTRNLLVDHYRRTRRDRITDSIDDAMPQLEETHSPVRSPDQMMQATELSEQLQQGLARSVAGTARGGDLARFAGARLQRDSHHSPGARGNREIRINRGRIELARVLEEMGVRPA